MTHDVQQPPVLELLRSKRGDISVENMAAVRMCLKRLRQAIILNDSRSWRCVQRASTALSAVTFESNPALGETAPLADRGGEAPKSLPFSGEARAPARTPLEPNPSMGRTASVNGAANRTSPLPFVGRRDDVVVIGDVSLTLTHHAQLSAHLAAFGFADAAAFGPVDAAWRQRLVREPDLQGRWAAAFDRAMQQDRSPSVHG